jgi:solute carrier family 35 protein E3
LSSREINRVFSYLETMAITIPDMTKIEDPAFFENDHDIEMLPDEGESDNLLDEKQQHDQDHQDHEAQHTPPASKKPSKLLLWIAINIIATTTIVFINKSIFDDPSFRHAQVSFATFHFLVTFATLHTVSSPRFAFFERKRAALKDITPLAAGMCLNVILPNLSLAYSSITFYQTARVLLTPITALLNFLLYRKSIPRLAVAALLPVCAGVAMVTYFDVQPTTATTTATEQKGSTSIYGVVFALSGVSMSGIYTCWISHYHTKLQMSSLQLLHNQSLLGGMLLIYLIPFVDILPVVSEVSLSRWLLILMVSFFFLFLFFLVSFFFPSFPFYLLSFQNLPFPFPLTCSLPLFFLLLSRQSMANHVTRAAFAHAYSISPNSPLLPAQVPSPAQSSVTPKPSLSSLLAGYGVVGR